MKVQIILLTFVGLLSCQQISKDEKEKSIIYSVSEDTMSWIDAVKVTSTATNSIFRNIKNKQ